MRARGIVFVAVGALAVAACVDQAYRWSQQPSAESPPDPSESHGPPPPFPPPCDEQCACLLNGVAIQDNQKPCTPVQQKLTCEMSNPVGKVVSWEICRLNAQQTGCFLEKKTEPLIGVCAWETCTPQKELFEHHLTCQFVPPGPPDENGVPAGPRCEPLTQTPATEYTYDATCTWKWNGTNGQWGFQLDGTGCSFTPAPGGGSGNDKCQGTCDFAWLDPYNDCNWYMPGPNRPESTKPPQAHVPTSCVLKDGSPVPQPPPDVPTPPGPGQHQQWPTPTGCATCHADGRADADRGRADATGRARAASAPH